MMLRTETSWYVTTSVLMRATGMISIIPTARQLDAAYTAAMLALEGEYRYKPWTHPVVVAHRKTRKATERS